MSTFAQRMVEKYERLLEENAGVESVDVDGVRVAFVELEKRYERWKRKRLIEQGKAATISRFRIRSPYV